MSNLPKFSRALLHPRYWLLWLGIGFLWLLVQLPYPVIYRLGTALGRLAMRVMNSRARYSVSVREGKKSSCMVPLRPLAGGAG